MAIRIGEDGTIINGDEVISSSGTVIRDDGTIESSNITVSNVPQRSYVSHTAPLSPFENGANRQTPPTETTPTPSVQPDRRTTISTTKSIADLEYDLMVAEGHVRGAIPKTPISVAIIMLICGILIHPVFLIGTVIAGIMIFSGVNKKGEYEKEVQRIKGEIESLKRQQRMGGV